MSCSKLQKTFHSPSPPPEDVIKLYFEVILPNEVIEHILGRLPFHDLVTLVPFVCKRWEAIHNKICQQKQRLVLFNMRGHDRVQDDIFFQWVAPDLQFSPVTTLIFYHSMLFWSNEQKRQLFMDKFPNITSIIVIENQYSERNKYDALFRLLRSYRTKLTEFSWFLHHVRKLPPDIWESFNRFLFGVNLSHLALYTGSNNALRDLTTPLLVGRLRSFYVGGCEMDLSDLTTTCRKLTLTNTKHETLIEQLRLISPLVAQQLLELNIYPKTEKLNHAYTHLLTGRFASLKCLYIRTKIPLAQLLTHLASLPKLMDLRLWHYLEPNKVSEVEAHELANLPQLVSVESLHLYIRFVQHDQLEWVSVAFPNLKYIKFDRFKSNCHVCDTRNKVRREQCERALFGPLKKCAQLKFVYFQRYTYREPRNLNDMTSITYDSIKASAL